MPSSSYVSPKSGMIRTPEATPGKDKLVKPEDKANEVNYSENNFPRSWTCFPGMYMIIPNFENIHSLIAAIIKSLW